MTRSRETRRKARAFADAIVSHELEHGHWAPLLDSSQTLDMVCSLCVCASLTPSAEKHARLVTLESELLGTAASIPEVADWIQQIAGPPPP